MANRYPILSEEGSEQSPLLQTGSLTNLGTGYWGINGLSASGSATGLLRPPAGTAVANTAPLLFQTGTLMSVPEAGAVEFNGTTLFMTTDGSRCAVDLTQDVMTSDITVANTITETPILAFTASADFLTVGKVIDIEAFGVYSTRNASDTITFRFKHNGVTAATITTPGKNVTDTGVTLRTLTTVQTTGSAGTDRHMMRLDGDGTPDANITSVTGSVDTTLELTMGVTAQWSVADVGNTITIRQAFTSLKN